MKTNMLQLLMALLIFISCKEVEKEQGPTQMETVIAIHDEVMPKMGHLGKLVGRLKPLADSLGTDSAEARVMKDLQDANEAMMDWMQEFGSRFEHEEIMEGKPLSTEKKRWLDEEETKVKIVKEKINFSISDAEALLKTNP